jgi:subtilase family serine protease
VAATSYSARARTATETLFSVTGQDSLLDLSSLRSLDDAFDDLYSWRTTVHTLLATSSGRIDLSGLDTITGPQRMEDQLRIRSESGGDIDLSGLLRKDGNVLVTVEAGAAEAESWEPVGPHPLADSPAGGILASLSGPTVSASPSELPSAGTVYWIGSGSGAWNNVNNWSTGRLPSPFEDVIIDVPGGEQTITFSGDHVVRSLQTEEALLIASGSLTVKADSHVGGTLLLSPNTTLTAIGAGVEFAVHDRVWIDGSSLNALQGASLYLPLATSFTNGQLTIEGGVLTAPNLTAIDNARFTLREGAQASIPATAYSAAGLPSNQTLFSVDGSGTVLELPALLVLDDSWNIASTSTAAAAHRIQATNGGRIGLPALQSISAPRRDKDRLEIVLRDGGRIDLQTLATVSSAGGQTVFAADAERYVLASLAQIANARFDLPSGGVLELPVLQSWHGGELVVPQVGSFELPLWQDASGLNVHLGSGGSLTAPRLASFTSSSLSLVGDQIFDAPMLARVDNSRFTVRGGAQLVLPVTEYSATGLPSNQTLFQAEGYGTRLEFPLLRTLDDGWTIASSSTAAQTHVIRATAGGEIRFAALESLTAPVRAQDLLQWQAIAGGKIELPALMSISSAGGQTRFDVTSREFSLPALHEVRNTSFALSPGSVLELPQLHSWNGGTAEVPAGGVYRVPQLELASSLTVGLSGAGRFEAASLQTFTFSTLAMAGGDVFAAPQLAHIDNSRFALRGGAQLTIAATGYSARELASSQTLFRVEGVGTVLNLPELRTIDDAWRITSTSAAAAQHRIEALAGGEIRLPVVQTLTSPVRSQDQLRIAVFSGGVVALPALGSIHSRGGQTWFETDAAELALPSLTQAANLHFQILPGTSIAADRLEAWHGGSLTLGAGAELRAAALTDATGFILSARDGSTLDAPNLARLAQSRVSLAGDHDYAWSHLIHIDDTRFALRDGARLALAATSYTSTHSATAPPLFSIQGPGTRLDLSSLTRLSDASSGAQTIRAADGGQLDLSGVEWIAAPASTSARLDLLARSGGAILLDSLRRTSSSGGQIVFDSDAPVSVLPGLALAENTRFVVPPAATLSLPLLTSWHGGELQVPTQAEFSLPALRQISRAAIRIGQQSVLRLPALESLSFGLLQLGGAQTLEVPQLASIDDTRLVLSGGAQLALPVTRYTVTASSQEAVLLSVSGQDTRLDLSSLRVLDASPAASARHVLEAVAGGTIDLASLETLTAQQGGTNRFELATRSGGQISLLSLSAIASAGAAVVFASDAAETELPELDRIASTSFELRTGASLGLPQLAEWRGGRLTVPADGEFSLPELRSADRVVVAVHDGGQLSAAKLTSFTRSALRLGTNQTVLIPAELAIDGSQFELRDGAVLNLAASSYVADALPQGQVIFAAQGRGTQLNLPQLGSLDLSGLTSAPTQIRATSEGSVQLAGLHTLGIPGGFSGRLTLLSDTGGELDLAAINRVHGWGELLIQAENSIHFGSGAVAIEGVKLNLNSTGRILSGTWNMDAEASLSGAGVLEANLVSSGTITPGAGSGTGTLKIEGDLSQLAGELVLQVAGRAAEDHYDILHVTGAAVLGGDLRLSAPAGFTAVVGESYRVIPFTSGSGQFDLIHGRTMVGAAKFEPRYAADGFYLDAISDNGPRVLSVEPSGTVDAAITQFLVRFDEPVLTTSLRDNTRLAGPQGEVTASSVSSLGDQVYRLNFAAQIAPGEYTLTIGPGTTDTSGNRLDQDRDGISGEQDEDVFEWELTLSSVEQAVLFVNVGGRSNSTANWLYQDLLAAGARARWLDLAQEGSVADLLQQEAYEQIWVVDLSNQDDGYTADWQSIADWFAAASADAIVADAAIRGTSTDQVENYYRNLQTAGGGLVLATGAEAYHGGINDLNDRLRIERFSGSEAEVWYAILDEESSLARVPHDLGSDLTLWDDSGRAPVGALPGGPALHAVAWADGDFAQPSLSSTLAGKSGFQAQIIWPLDESYEDELTEIEFRAAQTGTSQPVNYTWISDRDGPLGTGQSLSIATLSVGEHRITLQAEDAGGATDGDTISVHVQLLAGNLAIDLQPGSDTGVSETDNVTRIKQPVLDLIVNKPGRIEVDFESDGRIDVVRTVPAAGAYPFTAPEFQDGTYVVRAKFFPETGAAAEGTLSLRVDTQPPRQLAGAPTEQAPFYQRLIRFSEEMEWSGDLSTQMQLLGPGGQQIPLSNITHLGAQIRVDFPALVEPGTYLLTAPALTRDRAGNLMDQDGDGLGGEADDDRLLDAFTLLLDVTPPSVTSATPAGLIRSDLTVFAIAFNEEMQTDSFTADDVTLHGPSGPVDPTAIAIAAVNSRQFEIHVSPQSQEGAYRLAFGPDILDLTGNPMSSERTVDLTVDKTGPRIVAMTPEGFVEGRVNRLDVTFDSPVHSYNFPSSSVRVVGPNGPLSGIYLGSGTGTTLLVHIPLQSTNGEYLVAIGPQVTDPAGNPMDQDQDGVNGEEIEDVFHSSFTIALPDLHLVSVGAESEAVFGGDLAITWTVHNAGTATASQPWRERVWLSQNGVVDAADLLLVDQAYGGERSLDAAASAVRKMTVALPYLQSLLAGDYQLLVELDKDNTLVESVETNNFGASELFPVALPLPPDLQITAITSDKMAPLSGDQIEITWVVRNLGASATPSAHWGDDVYLSADETLDPQTDYYVGRISHSGVLAVDQPYVASTSLVVPLSYEGTYYVLVATDAGQQVKEREFEDNNVASLALDVQLRPAPDLEVVNVQAPDFGQPGATLGISWTVANTGQLPEWSPWYDRVYLSPSGQLHDATQVAARIRSEGLDAGGQYTRTVEVVLPALPDGNYHVLVWSDADQQIFERNREANNVAGAAQRLRVRHPDLVSRVVDAVASTVSGEELTVQWQTENRGTAATLGGWTDRIYLSRDARLSASDLQVGSVAYEQPLGVGESQMAAATFRVPIEYSGQYFLLVVTDADRQILEVVGETNNLLARPLNVELAPYANLVVSGVQAPAQTIADPATVAISWTVSNQGTGRGITDDWRDVVVVSVDDRLGNSDDRVLASFAHTGGLAVGADYSRTENIRLPNAFVGRYRLFVRTDADGQVFENALEDDNAARAEGWFDVMQIPYADLKVSQIQLPADAWSGRSAEVTWTVSNDGIGVTNRGDWLDQVYVASDAQGQHRVTPVWTFQHFGHLAVSDSYDRTGRIALPEGLDGNYYVVITTGDASQQYGQPFEFIHTNNNRRVSAAFPVQLTPPPDLAVSNVTAPLAVDEGQPIDVAWRVTNLHHDQHTGAAEGSWTDRVYLQRVGDGSIVPLGEFQYTGPLASGTFYTRSEVIQLPARLHGIYQLYVTTNAAHALYEHGASGNNTGKTELELEISVRPRPDLQVLSVVAPPSVDAGGTLSVQFDVGNQGTVATNVPRWLDRVYLSLDARISNDDILVGEFRNQSALLPGESYRTNTASVVVPQRFRGEIYVLVMADASGDLEEWPNDQNNLTWRKLYVNPLPLADLVVGQVVAPTQAIDGSEIEVRYTVTNLGAGPTQTDRWADTIWLTQDKNRPHPSHGDVLLKTIEHQGALPRNAGYDQVVKVQLPEGLRSGTYYIMPWTDPYKVVLEDSLAINNNPDDPHELDNNNYKARAITILGTRPDLHVTAVAAPDAVWGGDTLTVSWTVQNKGFGRTGAAGWVDRVYLTTEPDPFQPGVRYTYLGEFPRAHALAPGESYTTTRSIPLSPSAAGGFIVVVTDASNKISELDETNNRNRTYCSVSPLPSDLTVTEIVVPPQNFSGEKTTIRYTVTNVGTRPIWPGTEYWKDFVWLGTEDTFLRMRASYLGEVVHSNDGPLNPGDSYEVAFETTLPRGTQGDYFLHIHLDAHNDRTDPYSSRILREDWYPADKGDNSELLEYFRRWAYENPKNNLATAPIKIEFFEPDLTVTELIVPDLAFSGETIEVTYTVTNVGTRETRAGSWPDRLFLSQDASLDSRDLLLGTSTRRGTLAPGASYSQTIEIRLPDSIEGDFHLLAYTDSAAHVDRYGRSSIGIELPGVEFERANPLHPWDLASEAARSISRGRIHEYQGEGDNILEKRLPIQLVTPPDLQVTALSHDERVVRGGTLQVQYTVGNAGGDTPPSQQDWEDLIYLSRDQFLDLRADRFLGRVVHQGGLAAGGSYNVQQTLPIPVDMIGSFYVFVVTDPDRRTAIGEVFEGDNERNNDRSFAPPLIIQAPPQVDLQVTQIAMLPEIVRVGQSLEVTWTVTNHSQTTARGHWSDAVYLSRDESWDLEDWPLGRVAFDGQVSPADSYVASLTASLPPVLPGDYRILVRTDIFNQVPEGSGESNNLAFSAEPLEVRADTLQLDVPYLTTLSTGQERLLRVEVPLGRTLRVAVNSAAAQAANEVFLRFEAAPTSAQNDAAWRGSLAANVAAVVPATQPGFYYVLIRGHAEPAPHTPIQVLAQLLPLMITQVQTDVGGDGSFVTTEIQGAQFHANAVVRLLRPGSSAEFAPVQYQVVDATRIIAQFDLSGAPHGLYDLKVINPGGEEAVLPYRFQVERAIEPEVTIGVGGPRIVLAGDVGTYSVALQSLSNLDTPYTYFEIGIPEMGINEWVYGLPYARFFANVHGGPETGSIADLPWPELDARVNTTGHVLSSGYLFDHPADGFTGVTFNVSTYPGLRELHDQAFEELRARLYATMPEHERAGTLDGGPQDLDKIQPGLYGLFLLGAGIPDPFTAQFIPFQFHVVASATSLTRDEFLTHALAEADRLRAAILSDPAANSSLVALAADAEIWQQMYLASLEEGGLLRPEGDAAPIRQQPLISSLMATLATGVLAGPAGREIRTGDSLAEFFAHVRTWYGHDPQRLAPVESYLWNGNPIPEIPSPRSREAYLDIARDEADRLRIAVLDDRHASPTLYELAGDAELWQQMFLGALEEAGLLRVGPEDVSILAEPSIRGLIETLALGVAVGTGDLEYVTTGSLVELFEHLYVWYGHDPNLPAAAGGVFWNLIPMPLSPR